jgi:hypothetical protein
MGRTYNVHANACTAGCDGEGSTVDGVSLPTHEEAVTGKARFGSNEAASAE